MATHEEKIAAAQAAVPGVTDAEELERFIAYWWSQVPLLLAELPPPSQQADFIGALAITGVPAELQEQLKQHIRDSIGTAEA